MNTAATHLLRSLDNLGVQSVNFRVLSLGRALRHTPPVALTADATKCRLGFSIGDLFAAYAITPRKGSYELNVENGCLAFTSPVAIWRPRLALMRKRPVKAKATRRGLRMADAATPQKLAA